MKISDHRITIKTLRPSEHGWSKYSHQTHIGCCENYIDNWENKLVLNGYAVIKDFGVKRITAYSKPIKRKNGNLDAPNFKTKPFEDLKEGNYDSLLKVAKEASQSLYNRWETSNILMIICFNNKKEIIVILLELENDVLANIKNNTNLVNSKNLITAKVLTKAHKSFNFIKNLAQFYVNYISAHISDTDLVELEKSGVFNFDNIDDAKKRLNKYIAIRQGQPKFRKDLLENYKQKCCMTGCDVQDTLEACHVYPYMGPSTNHVQNGVILRSDLHTLYDRGLISINENYKILVSKVLKMSKFYNYLDGKNILLPDLKKHRPSLEAVKYKLKEFNE
jgi:hypothetical protein